MKKIFFITILSSIVFSSNLNEFVNEKIKTNLKKELLKIEKNNLKSNLGSLYAPKITPNFSYSYNRTLNNEKKYDVFNSLNSDINLSYGWFNYNIGLDLINQRITSNNISLSIPINNYLYNYRKENEINYEIDKLSALSKNEEELENILNIYSKFILKKYELEILNDELIKLENDDKVVSIQYKNGLISKNEYETFKNNLSISKLNSEISRDELELINLEMMENDIDVNNIPNFSFNILNNDEIINKVKRNLKMKDLEIEKKEIEYSKDMVLKVLPIMNISANHNFLNKSSSINISVSKTLDLGNNEYIEILEKKDEIERIKKINEISKEKVIKIKVNEYSKLKLSYITFLKNLETLVKELETLEIKFRQGNESYLKLLEKRKELKQAKINLKNIEMQLSIYEWKVKRGD